MRSRSPEQPIEDLCALEHWREHVLAWQRGQAYFEGWELHILQMGCLGDLLGPAEGWLNVVVVVAEDIFEGANCVRGYAI